MTYSEKLKDPRWQRLRLEIMKRDDFSCQLCGSKTETLHVHHKYYLIGNDPWVYPDESLVTLCEGCHSQEEELKVCQTYFLRQWMDRGFMNTDFERVHLAYDMKKELWMRFFDVSHNERFLAELETLMRKHNRYQLDTYQSGAIEDLPF
jgi:hypothetical protein